MKNEEWYEYLRFTKTQLILIVGFISFNVLIKVIPTIFNITDLKSSFYQEEDYSGDALAMSSIDKSIKLKSPKSVTFQQKKSKTSDYIRNNTLFIENHQKLEKQNQNFRFDPNLLSEDSIRLLTIPKKVQNNWIKYRNSGGKFYDKQSISKIFGLSENDRLKLIQRIDIISNCAKKNTNGAKSKIYVNSATTDDWKSIKGIGPYYATNIVEYRKSLGGFKNLDQIKEVYRLPDSTFLNMLPKLVLDKFSASFDINIISQKELYRHPYISYKQAQSITKYRDQHGNFESIEDLNKILSLDQSFIEKIKPYFYTDSTEQKTKELSSIN